MSEVQLIYSMISRVDSLIAELEGEFRRCLNDQEVSLKAVNLTHEVIEKCSNSLDQVMHLSWKTRILPKLPNLPKKGGRGYFPAAKDLNSFKSTMGQWGASDLDRLDSEFAVLLIKWQPFSNTENNWLLDLKELARSKHTGLLPQKRIEERQVHVESGHGSVSWGPGVKFGPGVSIMGAPINPHTQMPVPTAGVTTRVDIWVSFLLEGTNLNALLFCKTAAEGVRKIVGEFVSVLALRS